MQGETELVKTQENPIRADAGVQEAKDSASGDVVKDDSKMDEHKPADLKLHDRVEARWNNEPTGKFFPGTVVKIYPAAADTAGAPDIGPNETKRNETEEKSDDPNAYDIEFDPMPFDPANAMAKSKGILEPVLTTNFRRERICKVTEVIRLSDVLTTKSEFDGLASAFQFLVYFLLCALIPALFVDPGGPACRSEVNEAIASYEDSYGVVNYKADNYNLVDMESYIIGLMDSLISNSEDEDYKNHRVMIGDTKVQAFQNKLWLEMSNDAFGGAQQKQAAWQVLCNNSNHHVRQNVYCLDDYEQNIVDTSFFPEGYNFNALITPYHAPHNLSTAREIVDVLKNDIVPVLVPGLVHVQFKTVYQCDITPVGTR